MRHSKVITLLSDLGTRDVSVTNAKAVLLRHIPDASVTDISHHIAGHDLQQAAYLLLSAYIHFPAGAVHILPVAVFDGDNIRVLLAKKDGHYFIAPDNGLLSLAFGNELEEIWSCHELDRPFLFGQWMEYAAGIAARVFAGDPMPYPPYAMSKIARMQQPNVMPNGVDCNVLYVDTYGNVVLDITKRQFDEIVHQRPFAIQIMRTREIDGIKYNRMSEINAMSHHYNDVPVGEPLCRFNDSGFLELAFNHDNAATHLGIDIKAPGSLRYKAIKIFF